MKKLLFIMLAILMFACGDSEGTKEEGVAVCKDVDCGEVGQCIDFGGKADCLCPVGYYKKDLKCVEAGTSDKCEDITCGEFGKCVVTDDKATCDCDAGYYPENMICITGGTDYCKDIDCGEGSCIVANDAPLCACNTGYYANGLTCVEELALANHCEPLEASTGNIINITPSMTGQLTGLINDAKSGDVFLFEDGTYNLNGKHMWIKAANVTLRSKSGNPEAVIIDGNYKTTEIITIAASNVTIAEITLQKGYTHPIHVVSNSTGNVENTLIYRVNIIDPREQAIKINPNGGGFFPDNGVIACSTMKMTDEGRTHINTTTGGGCYTGGVDAHQAQGWVIRDNNISGFWCNSGLSEHAIHLWRGCKDTIVERNILTNNARGVGFGLASSGDPRTYTDHTCTTDAYIGHYGGIIRNNFIFANRAELFASNSFFDSGIALASSCNTKVYNNTIISTGKTFVSMEWRWEGSQGIEITNNIVSHSLKPRNGGLATLTTNLTSAPLSIFKDGANGDLHLKADATTAIDKGTKLDNNLCTTDIDGEDRDNSPDIGADEITK